MRTMRKLRMVTISVFALSMGLGLSASANSTGTTTWKADRPVGAVWSDAENWIGGLPLATEQARFTQTQTTTTVVIVNSDELFRETLVQQGATFNGTGSLTLEYAQDANEKILENHYTPQPTTTYDVDVTMRSTINTNFGMLHNNGTLTFNGALVLTNTVSLNAASRVKMEGTGTTTINGDFYHGAGIRLTAGTVVIGGSGTSSAESSTVMTLLGGELQLNRPGALDMDQITQEGTEITLGADNALLPGTDLRFIGGLLLAQGYDQDFGYLDVGNGSKSTVIDMGSSDSIWTFEDSSAQVWDGGVVAITNAENATIRFAGTGLTESQIGQITLNGTALTTNDTTVSGGYLYIVEGGAQAQYNNWTAGYALSSPDADLLSDPDEDGMNNLVEYALGGIPTNSDASAVLPAGSLVDDGGTLEMVYLRRLDAAARGLTYTVEKNGDLLATGSWITTGITETSGAVDAEFESVTNRIFTAAADAQFMKLSVELE